MIIRHRNKGFIIKKRARKRKLMSGAFGVFKKIISITCISGILLTMNLPLFSAYEAHVINVTAKFENDVPSVDPPGGEFCNDGSLEVTLSTTLIDPNTSIIYTIDGSDDPDCFIPNGTVYAGTPFPLTNSATVKARVCHYRDGELLQSVIMSEYYDVSAVYCDAVCGPCIGQVSELTLQYNGAEPADILVTMFQGGTLFILFDGLVPSGGQFDLIGPVDSTPSGTLDTNILLYVDNVENTEIHTSCSEAIGPGMVFGDFLVIAGASRIGGPLCACVVLNEFLPNPDGDDSAAMPDGEWVEVYNLYDQAFDLAGYYLIDGDGDRIDIESCRTNTGNTMIAGNGFLVVYRNGGDNCESNNFDLDNLSTQTEDTISLFDGAGIKFDEYTYTLEGACSLTPTPDDPNADNSLGECNTEVPSNKSYARIPDGVGDWIDPVPTPGISNTLEDYSAAPSDSTPDVVNIGSINDSDSGDNTEDSVDDSDSGVAFNTTSEDLDSGVDNEARDEDADNILDDVVVEEEDPDAAVDDEEEDLAVDDEEETDAVIDEEDDSVKEEDPDAAVDDEEEDLAVDDEEETDAVIDEDDIDTAIENEEDPAVDESEDAVVNSEDNNETEDVVDDTDDASVSKQGTETNSDELELEAVGADDTTVDDISEDETNGDADIVPDDIEDESDMVTSEEVEESAEEEIEEVTDDDMTVSDISESNIDSIDNDDPQTEDNGTVDNDGGGELPITPDEGAVIDFNLSI